MTLQEVLKALHVAALTFQNGTALTPENVHEGARHGRAFMELVAMAKRKGATPYEIVRAYSGEILGDSF